MHRQNSDEIYYFHLDVMGSLVAITNNSGNIVEQRSYDPWGRPRNPVTFEYSLPNPFGGASSIYTLRGYTFHEHLEWFDLINMNGRMYDAHLGQFLNADPILTDEFDGQNYNRYAYVLNNPLKYTDPTGYVSNNFGNGWPGQGGAININSASGVENWNNQLNGNQFLKTTISEMFDDFFMSSPMKDEPPKSRGGFLLGRSGSIQKTAPIPFDELVVTPNGGYRAITQVSNNMGLAQFGIYTPYYQNSWNIDQSKEWGGIIQEKVDFGGAVFGGLATVFGASGHLSGFKNVAGKIGFAGYLVTGLTYGHAVLTDQAKPAHHLDAGVTVVLIVGGLVSIVVPAIAPTVIGIGFGYGGGRLVVGEVFDNWFNSQFAPTPVLYPNNPNKVKP